MEVKPYRLWLEYGQLFVNIAGPGSGLDLGDVKVDVRSPSQEVDSVSKGSVAKLDCEGRERALLQVLCNMFK
ncbi:MAG: hypothetical protein ACP5IE_03645 [Infirmifilum sp.]